MLQQTSPGLRETYDRAFFAAQVEGSTRSASIMVPRIMELFPQTVSVVDVGCGTGVWLHHFKGAGVPRVLGLDGGAPDDGMPLRHSEFRRVNLVEHLHLESRFDLAMSLEVAEHLPPSAANTFVANLCRLSNVVVFGAAIPGQGGTWHVNERWASYWVALFNAEGYDCFDVLRPQAWYDQRVEWWYAQNTLVFVHRGQDELVERLRALVARQSQAAPLDVVHPRCFAAYRRSLEFNQQAATAMPSTHAIGAAGMQTNWTDRSAAAAEARATDAEMRLAAILRSTSWRITGPVRRLAEPLPRMRAVSRVVLAPLWRTARNIARTIFPRRFDTDR